MIITEHYEEIYASTFNSKFLERHKPQEFPVLVFYCCVKNYQKSKDLTT